MYRKSHFLYERLSFRQKRNPGPAGKTCRLGYVYFSDTVHMDQTVYKGFRGKEESVGNVLTLKTIENGGMLIEEI